MAGGRSLRASSPRVQISVNDLEKVTVKVIPRMKSDNILPGLGCLLRP